MLIAVLTFVFVSTVSSFLRESSPLALIASVSTLTGLLMVLVFRYVSDQTAIHAAKEQLKAHVLAVRLYQDQIPVVLHSYGRILKGTGRYLRLAFIPVLYVVLPITLLISQLDRYWGFVPLHTGQEFLVTARTAAPTSPEVLSLQLPAGMRETAPAVHIPSDNEVLWRVVADRYGKYQLGVSSRGQTFLKQSTVWPGVARLSPIRLRGHWWERLSISSEPALPEGGGIQSIEVAYPVRTLRFAWVDWNWIWLFFCLSLVAGFFFKTVLRIEI